MIAFLYIGIILSFLLCCLFGIVLFSLHQGLKKLLKGAKGADLELVIKKNKKEIERLEEELKKQNNRLSFLEKESQYNLQKVRVLHFNPFKEMGGRESFSLCFSDKNKNGVIISALYNRNHMHLMAKKIEKGISSHQLTKEEMLVLD